jgi:hypothetical protein
VAYQNGVLIDTLQFTIRVTADGPATNYQALAALVTQYPVNSPHPSNPVMVASWPRITQVLSPGSAFVGQVPYTQVQGGSNPALPTDVAGLLNLPAQVESISTGYYEQEQEFDKFGDPIINSAGTPFYPPPTIELTRTILTLSKYKQTYAANTYVPFFGKLNNAAFQCPGIGGVLKRQLRCMDVRPATGFQPTIVVQATGGISGTFAAGEVVTWPGGSASFVGSTITPTTITLMNPTVSINVGTVLTGATSGATATASAAAILQPVKLFWILEYRPNGFDGKVEDRGGQAWGTDGTDDILCHIVLKGAAAPGGEQIVDLHGGVPASPSDYMPFNTKATGWSTNTAVDKLAARVTANKVTRTTSGAVDFLQFQRIDDVDFAGIGL